MLKLNEADVLNRSDIMRKAWRFYRIYAVRSAAFDRSLFASCLRDAWNQARAGAKLTAWLAECDREEAEEAARQTAAEAALAAMNRELAALEYLPFGMSAASRAVEIRARYASQIAA